MGDTILIYGSYGYTGELITELAVAEGAKPVLAGRSADKVEPQAAAHDLEFRVFGLDDPAAIDAALQDVAVVLHCAGPFSRTAKPMADACLRTGTHYLDITGEIEVFETMAARDAQAKEVGVMLMPGTGFDVVPSDCLAAHLKRRLPEATELTLAFKAIGKPSRGTATTMIENVHKGGMIRRDGKLTPVPSAWQTRDIDFGPGGNATAMTIPWGDVSTAFYSTGIPNIQVFMSAPPELRRMSKISRYLGWLMASAPVQAMLKKQIQAGPPGPSDDERRTGQSFLWGEAKNGGRAVHTRLHTPEGYSLTAATAWEIAKRSAAGSARPGFQTPSMVFGADFILEFDGVERTDLD